MTLAPLVAKGKVMVGVSGGEYGIRGYVAAYDVNGADNAQLTAAPQVTDVEAVADPVRDGKELWRTFTVPGPGEPGNESWPGDDLGARRCLDLDHRQLRPGQRHRVLGHWQRFALDAGRAFGRQSLRQLRHLARRRYRQDERPSPVPAKRGVGLGRGFRSDPRSTCRAGTVARSRAWSTPAATVTCGSWSAADAGKISYIRAQPFVRQNVFTKLDPADRASRVRSGPSAGDREARRSSVRRFGAARTGRPRPTTHRPAICTCRPTKICAAS